MDDAALGLLPSLKRLRDALYSQQFRNYLCKVTESTFVSGKKTDMAINVYTPGCHLLCHDDVIGSRRISYILYLTDPDKPWEEDWGGALRLYPTEEVKDEEGKVLLIPKPEYSKSIPPAFNQLSFFAVQPGQSFHDVEEVYADTDDKTKAADNDKIRMAISGWYHIPQPDEEGYNEGEEKDLATTSSLAQLQGRSDVHDRPQTDVTAYASNTHATKKSLPTPKSSQEELTLSENDLDFLLKYIAPSYLTPDALESVVSTFSDECSIVLDQFLSRKFSDPLRTQLELLESDPDKQDAPWEVARPPHKHHYLYQRQKHSEASSSSLQDILTNLLPSQPFQKWLQLATGQSITTHDCLARRFRRGKDYTLAQSYDCEEPRLELCLSITPSSGWGDDKLEATEDAKEPKERDEKDQEKQAGEVELEVGGYLAYMAGEDHDEEDEEISNHGVEVPLDMSTGGRASKAKKPKADPAIYQAQDDDEDGVLFSMPAGWNKLGIVLRDQGTMRFVKYVSKSARGDRWDIFGEFEIEDDGSNDEEATTIHENDDESDDNDRDDESESTDEDDD